MLREEVSLSVTKILAFSKGVEENLEKFKKKYGSSEMSFSFPFSKLFSFSRLKKKIFDMVTTRVELATLA
jgi:hypothetical protein